VNTLNPPITLAAYGYDYSKPVNLAEFILYTGNTGLPAAYRSENNYVGVNYTNNALTSHLRSNYSRWYDQIRANIVSKVSASSVNITTFNTGTLSSQLVVSPNSFVVKEWNSDLAINSGVVCDLKAVILVAGNLTLNPDFRVNGNNNGCIFVTAGNVTITTGDRKNPASAAANTPSHYDLVEALFIVEGQFNTQLDVFTDGRKGDGLLLKGGLITRRIDLRRDLTGYSNTNQPAEVFIYDSRYIAIPEFANVLDSKEISIREF
jgi:hypothetical protein